MSGINSTNFNGTTKPRGVPNPTQKAIKVNSTSVAGGGSANTTSNSTGLVYSRRYLDWNRLTFAYHAVGSQSNTFDYPSGERVSANITTTRLELNLTALYGCAPASYCQTCQPFGADGNIFGLLATALSATVINQTRANIPRLIIINTGSVRFDLFEGPFTVSLHHIIKSFYHSCTIVVR